MGSGAPSTIKSCGVLTVRHPPSGYATEHGEVGSVQGGRAGGGPGGGGGRSNDSHSGDVVFWLQSEPVQQPAAPGAYDTFLRGRTGAGEAR